MTSSLNDLIIDREITSQSQKSVVKYKLAAARHKADPDSVPRRIERIQSIVDSYVSLHIMILCHPDWWSNRTNLHNTSSDSMLRMLNECLADVGDCPEPSYELHAK